MDRGSAGAGNTLFIIKTFNIRAAQDGRKR
jgi:hypothetical protein